jgi:hypothetical protein
MFDSSPYPADVCNRAKNLEYSFANLGQKRVAFGFHFFAYLLFNPGKQERFIVKPLDPTISISR